MTDVGLAKYLDAATWGLPPQHQYAYQVGELWYPFSAALDFWNDGFHELMLCDYVRMRAYCAAIDHAIPLLIERARKRGSKCVRILDIGTGHGIWAYHIYARLRHELAEDEQGIFKKFRIYGLEGNTFTYQKTKVLLRADPTVVAAVNCSSWSFAERVILDRGRFRVFDRELLRSFCNKRTKLFDMIVSECIGGIGDDEGIIEIFRDAIPRFAKADCLVIPTSIEGWAVPISEQIASDADLARSSDGPSLYDQVRQFVSTGDPALIHGMDGENGDKKLLLLRTSTTPFFDVVLPKTMHAAEPKKLTFFDFTASGALKLSYRETTEFIINALPESHVITAFKMYFKAILFAHQNDVVRLDISGDHLTDSANRASDCWKHTYLPLNEPLRVSAGDHVMFTLVRNGAPAAGHRSPAYAIEYRWDVSSSGARSTPVTNSFTLLHRTLLNDRGALKRQIYGPYDKYRTIGTLSDIILGLSVAALFEIFVRFSDTEITSWEWVLIPGLFLLFLRVVHSFHLLSSDKEFQKIEHEQFTDLSRTQRYTRMGSRTILSLIVLSLVLIMEKPFFIPLRSAVLDRAGLIALIPFVTFTILAWWDLETFRVILAAGGKAAPRRGKRTIIRAAFQTFRESEYESKSWYVIVKKTVATWIILDTISFGILFVFGMLDLFNIMTVGSVFDKVMMIIKCVSAFVLIGSFAVDYLWNAEFYSGRLKEIEEEKELMDHL